MIESRLLRRTWPAWEIVREVGAGTEGTVFVVRRTDGAAGEPRHAALKVCRVRDAVRGRQAQTGRALPRLLREALPAHPNIVGILDWAQVAEDGEHHLLILMELLVPLEEYVGFDVRQVGLDVAAALSALHGAGIYHLDVKPHNILVSDDLTFKLGDLGSSRSLYDLNKGDFPPGTLHYAAPEVLARRSLITTARQAAKADIHSLGMVLFEMLMWQRYGRDVHGPADEAHDREEWFSIQRDYEIADEPRPTGSYLELVPAPELMDVIRRAISEGSLRYDSAEELRADLAAAADDTYGTFRREADVDARAALAASLESLVAGDVRESLILTFDSGAHVRLPHADGPRRFALMPTGLRLTHIGHPMPTSLTLDGTHVPFDSDEGFVDLDLALTYGEATPPSPIEVCVTYPDGSTFSWSLSFGPADRDWEWFKRPDWT